MANSSPASEPSTANQQRPHSQTRVDSSTESPTTRIHRETAPGTGLEHHSRLLLPPSLATPHFSPSDKSELNGSRPVQDRLETGPTPDQRTASLGSLHAVMVCTGTQDYPSTVEIPSENRTAILDNRSVTSYENRDVTINRAIKHVHTTAAPARAPAGAAVSPVSSQTRRSHGDLRVYDMKAKPRGMTSQSSSLCSLS